MRANPPRHRLPFCNRFKRQKTGGTITGLKLHAGGVGVEGPELLDLSSFVSGKFAVGKFSTTPAILTALFSGEIYLNRSTSASASGVWKSTDSPAFSEAKALLFDQSQIRLDISSAKNPTGELSGL